MADRAVITTLFNADVSQLKSGMQQAETQAGTLQATFKTLGGVLVGVFSARAVFNFGREVLQAADDVQDAAGRMGIGVETLQTLTVKAQEAGLRFEDFEQAIMKSSRAVAEADGGNKQLAKAFEDIGLNVDQLLKMKPEDRFYAIAKALKDNGDNAETTRAAYDIFGKTAGKVLEEIIKLGGSEGFGQLNKEMRESNKILDEMTNKRLADANDTWERVGRTTKIWGAEFIDLMMRAGQATGLAFSTVFDSIEETRRKTDELFGSWEKMDDPINEVASSLGEAALAAGDLSKFTTSISNLQPQVTQQAKDHSETLAGLINQSEIILRTTKDMRPAYEDANKELEPTVDKSASVARALTDAANMVPLMGKNIKKLSEEELKALEANLWAIKAVVDQLAAAGGFPDIKLPDFSQLNNIPEWIRNQRSSDAVRNFGEALRAMASALQTVQQMGGMPDLSISLPDTSKTDLKGLADVLRATTNARFGTLEMKLDYPESGIPLDTSGLKLDQIASSLHTLAGLKGIVWY